MTNTSTVSPPSASSLAASLPAAALAAIVEKMTVGLRRKIATRRKRAAAFRSKATKAVEELAEMEAQLAKFASLVAVVTK